MLIQIKNMRLRTLIGIFDWEREHRQDVVINMRIAFDGSKAAESDKIEDTYDYKTLSKKIIQLVENSEFYLLEKLAQAILDVIMEHPLVENAGVEVDKPGALRYSDSVSVSTSASRSL